VFVDEVEGFRHAGQHPERQDIHLHELQCLNVILVPFDDLPVFHRGGFDRHEIVQPVMGEDKAAGMLAEMTRRAHQLLREFQGQR